jgi:hypothetical protein
MGISAVHAEVARTITNLPANASAGDTVRAGIHAHLRALFEFSDYTSANVRIYGQVPEPVRRANRKVRREYEALWGGILERIAEEGGVRSGIDLNAFRLMLIGSLNATLEWFDTKRDSLTELGDSYADLMLQGILPCRELQR